MINDGAAIVYDAAGNISSRGATGYTYAAGTHRMTGHGATGYGYDANGNVTSITGGTQRTIAPTAFNLPASITQGSTALTYVYDGAHRRIKETATTAAGTTTTVYLGGYEELTRTDGVTERRHWISSPEGAVGIHTTRSDGSTASRYWLTDHLGSVVGVVDESGVVKQRAGYATWGGKTQVQNSDARAEDRGYTGHEHLVEVDLIHMNGRVYDPGTGRFLSADPLIQDPYDGQSYNRYSYVKNNPLSFTDPSGYSWWTKWRKPIAAIAASVVTFGAVSAFAASYISASTFAAELAAGASAYEAGMVATYTVANSSVAISTVAGTASGFASGGIMGGNIESAIYGAINGGVTGGMTAAVAGLDPIAQVATKSATSAALAYVNGGDWRNAGAYAAIGSLAGAGFELMRADSDRLYLAACATAGDCARDDFGLTTDGARSLRRSIEEAEWASIPRPVREFIGAGMPKEGSPQLYDIGQQPCTAMGDLLCGVTRGFVRQVSKVHDFGNSWSYDRNPSSPFYGFRLEGGGFSTLAARVTYEVAIQGWSLATMPLAAMYTGFALNGNFGNPEVFGRRR